MANIQFNATNGKAFRNNMAKYHNARHALADYINKANANLSSWKTIAKNDAEDLKALDTGNADGILRDRDSILKSGANALANIERIEGDLKKAREKSAKAMANAEALVTDELYEAYAEDENFAEAIATWFKANGFEDATAENCEAYTRYIGSRSKKNGAKASAKSGVLQTAQTKKSFITIWLGALCDDLQNAGIINAYKYTFDVTKKPEKK